MLPWKCFAVGGLKCPSWPSAFLCVFCFSSPKETSIHFLTQASEVQASPLKALPALSVQHRPSADLWHQEQCKADMLQYVFFTLSMYCEADTGAHSLQLLTSWFINLVSKLNIWQCTYCSNLIAKLEKHKKILIFQNYFTFSHIKSYFSLDTFSAFQYQRFNVQDSYKDQCLSLKQRNNRFWTEDAYYLLMGNNFKMILLFSLSFLSPFLVVGVGVPTLGLVNLFLHDFSLKWTSRKAQLKSIIYPLPSLQS